MLPYRRYLYSFGALLCLAALIAACGGASPTQGETPNPGTGQTGIETKPAAPTALPTGFEPVSPLLPGQSPLPTPTGSPETEADEPPSGPVPIEITPPAAAPLTGEVPQDLLDAILDDLAEQQDASREAIEIEQAGAVIWRDGSLGCPQPGMMYTQALVDGYLIQLQVDGQAYNYHGAQGRDPFLCIDESGTPQSPPPELRGGDLSTPAVQEE